MKILTVAVTNLAVFLKIEHVEKCPKHFHKILHYTSYVLKSVEMSLIKIRPNNILYEMLFVINSLSQMNVP